MNPEVKSRIQIVLGIALALAAVRTAYILYQRHPANTTQNAQQAALPLNPDYYVTPRKLHPYDLRTAKQLTQQPVWVKEGYRYTYYPYDPARHRTEFSHESGQLLPIEELQIKDVVTEATPKERGQRQVMAVFDKAGKTYAVPIGLVAGDNYQIYSDEMFYIQDPHQLYKHWPADVWNAIEQHQVKTGMNELQADFAIGMGVPQRSDDPRVKTVDYPNGGNPISITYRDGKAAEIKRQ